MIFNFTIWQKRQRKDDKPKKERANKYDVKLAVNASFTEVFK